jgi:dipeptidyl aminopeptidase/acylaminoacyl peptidase
MSETKELLQRGGEGFAPREDVMNSLIRLRARKQRNRRIASAAVALLVTLAAFVSLVRAFGAGTRPAEPTPTPSGIFSHVGGWIAYGYGNALSGQLGVWAVDPTHPNAEAPTRLSTFPGEPLAWSSDGSKLLLWELGARTSSLWVLNADGSRSVLTSRARGPFRFLPPAGSFSPDGSRIIIAVRSGIYSLNLAGAHSLIRAVERVPGSSGKDGLRHAFSGAAMSPDGTQIAYVDTWFDAGQTGQTLRVMDADGTDVRVLVDGNATDRCGAMGQPSWSPDGTRLAFGCHNGIWEVGADGSGLTQIIAKRLGRSWAPINWFRSPDWSPDGTRIAFTIYGAIRTGSPPNTISGPPHIAIADADGSHIRTVGHLVQRPGAWNPLPHLVPGQGKGSTADSGVPPFVLVIVVLGVIGVAVLRRGRATNPPTNVGS